MKPPPRKGRPRVISAPDKFIRVSRLRNHKLTAPQSLHQLLTADWRISLYAQMAAKKPRLRKRSEQKRFVWAEKHEEEKLERWTSALRPDTCGSLVPSAASLCDAEKVNRWSLNARFPRWRLQEEVWWPGGGPAFVPQQRPSWRVCKAGIKAKGGCVEVQLFHTPLIPYMFTYSFDAFSEDLQSEESWK